MSKADSPLFPDIANGPDFGTETDLVQRGIAQVAGVDEVGRGPLAGPVVAAAVILDPAHIPGGLQDSKKLTEKRREILFDQILKTSDVAWASLPAAEIDALNIRGATLRAMTLAVDALPNTPGHVLVDGRDIPPSLSIPGTAMIKGDARSVSIAAASIVAKVIRDRMMIKAARHWPHYGFERHKGYGSKLHRDAILAHGPCPLHRRSFSPVKDMF